MASTIGHPRPGRPRSTPVTRVPVPDLCCLWAETDTTPNRHRPGRHPRRRDTGRRGRRGVARAGPCRRRRTPGPGARAASSAPSHPRRERGPRRRDEGIAGIVSMPAGLTHLGVLWARHAAATHINLYVTNVPRTPAAALPGRRTAARRGAPGAAGRRSTPERHRPLVRRHALRRAARGRRARRLPRHGRRCPVGARGLSVPSRRDAVSDDRD